MALSLWNHAASHSFHKLKADFLSISLTCPSTMYSYQSKLYGRRLHLAEETPKVTSNKTNISSYSSPKDDRLGDSSLAKVY